MSSRQNTHEKVVFCGVHYNLKSRIKSETRLRKKKQAALLKMARTPLFRLFLSLFCEQKTKVVTLLKTCPFQNDIMLPCENEHIKKCAALT